jgi:hypothetical protein
VPKKKNRPLGAASLFTSECAGEDLNLHDRNGH